MSVNATLRLPEDLAALLDQAASESGQSRHAFIIRVLRDAVRRDDELAGLRLGFVELRGSELDPTEVDCPECGQPLERPCIGFLAGTYRPIPYGPICYICAAADYEPPAGLL